jgi:hypothetical protein
MKSKFNLVLTIILLIGISVGSFFLGKTLGFLSTNQTVLGKYFYDEGYVAGSAEGAKDGNNDGIYYGNEKGKKDRMEYVTESTSGRITWK